MDRTILHCDCNSYYASVELLSRPELRALPVAVCGDPSARHGVILAKNEPAKRMGVRTAETIVSARRKCPELILLSPHHDLYAEYCRRINAIYGQYTDLVEAASVDESYLDVTASRALFGTGEHIANELRRRVKAELGLTISVGVSFNKTFAKLGSDYKKPDATTVISRGNYRDILYPLPISDMMYVGRASAGVLSRAGIMTLGDIYEAGAERMTQLLGKGGESLWRNVAGLDDSPVMPQEHHEPAKSIGNSLTFRRDLISEADFTAGLTMLCESVGERLRAAGMYCACVTVQIKDPQLKVISRQTHLRAPTCATSDILNAARELMRRNWREGAPVRMLSVSVSALTDGPGAHQLSFFDDGEAARKRDERLYSAIDGIRARFGGSALCMGSVLATDIVSPRTDNAEGADGQRDAREGDANSKRD